MLKFFLIFIFTVFGVCFADTISYSKLSLRTIENDLANCPQKRPRLNVSCSELKKMAERINDLAIQLQFDRQGYGKAILCAQEKLAAQQELLLKNQEDKHLAAEIANNKQEINERLVVVKWLESPR